MPATAASSVGVPRRSHERPRHLTRRERMLQQVRAAVAADAQRRCYEAWLQHERRVRSARVLQRAARRRAPLTVEGGFVLV